MALKVSDVLGLDRLRALRAEGKDNAAILEEVNAILDPIKKNIGEDVYTSFSERGISFSKMKEYSDYQAQLAVEAAKAAEDKVYADDVAFAKDTFKKEYSGTGFKDRLDRGVGRVITELNVAAHNLVGAKPDPQRVAFLQADDEIAAAYEDAHRTPKQKKIYKEKEQAFADANGTVDTITTGADMLWQKVKNPNEWDMAGLMADLANPVNLAGGGAGALATKALANTAIKTGAKVAVGTGTSAAVDGGLGYGYDYNVQKGRGRSDEEATKAATLGLAANVTMGAGTGAFTSLLTSRLGKTAPKDVAPTDTADKTFSMMDGTVISKNEFDLMGADEVLKTLEQNKVAIPDDIKNSALLKVVNESEDHSAKAMEVIKTIDETTTNTAEREAKVAKYAPPTEFETYTNKALNDGEVAPSMYGSRARNKLEVSIENADNISMEQVNAKLDEYGIVGEHKAVILDAYARRDIGYYDDWATSKIQQKGDADARANAGDGRKDTTVQTDRTDTVDAGVRETVEPNAEPKTVPEPKAGDRENTGTTGRNTGDVDPKNGVPKTDKTVDGQSTVTDDGGTLPGDRKNNLVQNENGVLVDGEVASTPLSKAGEVYTVDAKKFDSSAVDAPTETNIPKFMLDFKDPVKTPIGEFKINTDYLLNKAMERDSGLRANELHLIKPTLTDPAYVVNYRGAYHFIKPFTVAGKVKKYLSVVSDKKGNVQFVTAHKMKGNGYKKILNEGDVIVDNVGGLLRAGAKSTESRNLKPATLSKSIAEPTLDVKDIKTRNQLLAHRYYDDVLESVQRSDAPSKYTAAQIIGLKNKKLGNKLATKFREDMRTYAKNPKYVEQRAKTDTQFRQLNDTAEVLSQMKLDDALDLVVSDSFKKSFDDPMAVNDMVTSIDNHLTDVGKKVNGKVSELDVLFTKDDSMKLSDVQNNILANTKDPLKRTNQKLEFELTTLEGRLKTAESKGDTAKVSIAKNELKKWKKENMSDGKIKQIGDC